MRRDEQILDAAADQFLERGFNNVTLDEIGAQVGITGPAIYRHFSSKDELLATLFDQAMDHLLLLVDQSSGVTEPNAALDGLVRAQVEFVLTDRRLVSVYAREYQSLSDMWRRRHNRRQREQIMRWVHALEAVYPHRSQAELHSATHACIGMALSVAQWPRDALRAPDLNVLLHSMIHGALEALAAPAP
jgi:AcrR family transcriptional regulator